MSWANSNLVCHGSEHLPAAIMGWFVLFFVTFGYPAHIRKAPAGLGNASKLQKIQYKKFFGDDFAPKNFWFFHVHFVVMAVLVSTKVVLSAANDMAQIAKLALNSLDFGIHAALSYQASLYQNDAMEGTREAIHSVVGAACFNAGLPCVFVRGA